MARADTIIRPAERREIASTFFVSTAFRERDQQAAGALDWHALPRLRIWLVIASGFGDICRPEGFPVLIVDNQRQASP